MKKATAKAQRTQRSSKKFIFSRALAVADICTAVALSA
jgi:hypothetical protein